MSRKWQGRTLTSLGIVLLGLSLSLGPAEAKPTKNDKFTAGSNPTGIAVVDDDLLLASVAVDDDMHEADGSLDSCEELLTAQMLGIELTPEELILAPEAHRLATGRGCTIAILDGGFRTTHPAIAGNVLPDGYDAVDDDFDPNDPGNGVDDDGDGIVDGALGHGTFVAGMVLRAAPDARILPVRVRDDEGYGTNETLKRGISFARSRGVDVINISLEKAGSKNAGLSSLLNKAVASGIVLVVSAGNDGSRELSEFAWGPGRIAVGAVDGFDRIAEFSNLSYDPCAPLMFAPGVDLLGPMGYPHEDSLRIWSGTSFSAGFVSGAVAVAREIRPDRLPEDVVADIFSACEPVCPEGSSTPEGKGRLNLLSLVLR